MTAWPTKPFLYEINTAVWLSTLSRQYRQPITLANVPDEALDELVRVNVNVIWLMGIWQRSDAARRNALNYMVEYRQVLPDLTEADVIGSAYAIGDYRVAAQFGGREALATLRNRLQERDLKLILDYVPNHIALDHPWVTQKPRYLIRGTRDDLEAKPDFFFTAQDAQGQTIIAAHGRDPYFPPWNDTAQVNVFSAELRLEAQQTVVDIAAQCDGVRCDMAMLALNDVFAKTWSAYLTGRAPRTEFWEELIPAVKQQYPEFKFIAEVYWDLERVLLRQGFDMTYDKHLYDYIHDGRIDDIYIHLQTRIAHQERQIRFIENHDEARSIASMGIEKERAAATLICGLPGGILLHDGQLTGRRSKVPVQVNRQPNEPPHQALAEFYHRLLSETRAAIYQKGSWHLFAIDEAYTGNPTYRNLLAYGWSHDGEYRVIVVNLTGQWSQGIIRLDEWRPMRGRCWRLYDVLSGDYTYRDGNKIADAGLGVELEAFQSRIFRFEKVDEIRDLR